jgi:hypothetical protein
LGAHGPADPGIFGFMSGELTNTLMFHVKHQEQNRRGECDGWLPQ